ncbi:hypothetical protein Tcan_01526, partial [Toxocara canis]
MDASVQQNGRCRDLTRFRRSERILKNENHRITTQKHLRDESILRHWLSLLFAFTGLRQLRPHLFDVLKNHIAVPPVESFDPTQQLSIVSTVNHHLCVVFDRLSEDRKRSNVEFLLLLCLELLLCHLRARLSY